MHERAACAHVMSEPSARARGPYILPYSYFPLVRSRGTRCRCHRSSDQDYLKIAPNDTDGLVTSRRNLVYNSWYLKLGAFRNLAPVSPGSVDNPYCSTSLCREVRHSCRSRSTKFSMYRGVHGRVYTRALNLVLEYALLHHALNRVICTEWECPWECRCSVCKIGCIHI